MSERSGLHMTIQFSTKGNNGAWPRFFLVAGEKQQKTKAKDCEEKLSE